MFNSIDSRRTSQLACLFFGADVHSFEFGECLESNVMFVDLCRMFKLVCSLLLQVKIPSNVSVRVLISADLCRVSQLVC